MDSRRGRRRPRPAAAALAGAAALTCTAALAAGCSGAGPDGGTAAPAPTTTTVEPTSSPAASASTSTAPAPAFDCPAVQVAQDELDDALSTELDRLDVDRGDPRAQSVYALVTTAEGPAYYAAVLAAAPPELRADAQLVLDYYRRLALAAGELDPGSGSTADLTAAVAALDRAAGAVDDPAAGGAVVDAQERLRAALGRSCRDGSATASPSTGPATPSGAPTGTATAPAATTGVAAGA
ncbi:hypothetical protein [Kineococcus indalonis]|uniref:hypothetical protein n=1 Tax=Kineococcus indalonis TaxID=2696566 RepID=UPI0014137779|nr:hypothetical protein [Kineococcus indalonis]NAZ85600.1 hypothetical protein [Kineococcus indalonis]